MPQSTARCYAVPRRCSVSGAAEVLGGPADGRTRVWVRLTGAGGTSGFPCERDGHLWRAQLPGQRPGAYSVTVSAAGVPGAGQLRCRDLLQVVAVP